MINLTLRTGICSPGLKTTSSPWTGIWTPSPGTQGCTGIWPQFSWVVASHLSLCPKLMSIWHPAASDVLRLMVFLPFSLLPPILVFSAWGSILPGFRFLPYLPTQPLLILSQSARAHCLPGCLPLSAVLLSQLSSVLPCHLSMLPRSVSRAQPFPSLVIFLTYWEADRVWKIIWAAKIIQWRSYSYSWKSCSLRGINSYFRHCCN